MVAQCERMADNYVDSTVIKPIVQLGNIGQLDTTEVVTILCAYFGDKAFMAKYDTAMVVQLFYFKV